MQQTYVQRIRVVFRKIGATRYTSHLDVARTWERILNRAKVPVDYSHGFNRRPKMQFATATALGTTSDCEVMDIWLREEREPAEVQEMMQSRIAPGIEIREVYTVKTKEASLQAMTRETTFRATISEGISAEALKAGVDKMIAAESIIRERKAKKGKIKSYDLRPLIFDLALEEHDGIFDLTMRLALEPGKTGRPDELLKQLGLDPLDVRIHRIKLVLDHGDKQITY